jgi:hypothetical protein
MGGVNKKGNSSRSTTCARMDFICPMDVSVDWRCGFAGVFTSAGYTAVFGLANTLPASRKRSLVV